jgi:hypothetical protein
MKFIPFVGCVAIGALNIPFIIKDVTSWPSWIALTFCWIVAIFLLFLEDL